MNYELARITQEVLELQTQNRRLSARLEKCESVIASLQKAVQDEFSTINGIVDQQTETMKDVLELEKEVYKW